MTALLRSPLGPAAGHAALMGRWCSHGAAAATEARGLTRSPGLAPRWRPRRPSAPRRLLLRIHAAAQSPLPGGGGPVAGGRRSRGGGWVEANGMPAPGQQAAGRPREGLDLSPLQRRKGVAQTGDRSIWLRRLMRMKPTARILAVEQLLRIEDEGAFIGLASGAPASLATEEEDPFGPTGAQARGKVQARAELTPQDRRLVTELVAGCTRLRRSLDYTLAAMLGGVGRMDGLDEPLGHILRMGLYELVQLNLPGHAINEHVELAKKCVRPEAGKMVNGVLRNAVRLREQGELPTPPLPDKGMGPGEVVSTLAVAFSHPDWMVDLWVQQYGLRATVRLMRWNNSRPEHGLRLSPSLGMTPEQFSRALEANPSVQAEPSAYLPDEFVRVHSGMQAIVSSPWMLAGQVQVQDEAAGMVVAMLDPQPGELVLDACAAPGGKTMFAAARMGGQGHIVAADVSAARLQALAAMARRQGVMDMIELQAADLSSPPRPALRPRHQHLRQGVGGVGGAALATGASPRAAGARPGGSPGSTAASAAAAGAGAGAPSAASPEAVAAEAAGLVLPQQQQQQRPPSGGGSSGGAAGAAAAAAAGSPSASTAASSLSRSLSPGPPSSSRSLSPGGGAGGGGAVTSAAGGSAGSLWQRQFDRVLLDVPCTGLGVLAKRADLRWRRTKRDLRELVVLQARLLDSAAQLVRPGGVLLYSTCSIEAAENQDQIGVFLDKHPEFEIERPPPGTVPDAVLTAEGFLCTFPPEHGVDGAFAARMRRKA